MVGFKGFKASPGFVRVEGSGFSPQKRGLTVRVRRGFGGYAFFCTIVIRRSPPRAYSNHDGPYGGPTLPR